MNKAKIFGIAAEFGTHEQLLHAAKDAYARGFRKMDGYAPFPVEGLAEALGKKNRLPLFVLCGGVVGGLGGYFVADVWTTARSWTSAYPARRQASR